MNKLQAMLPVCRQRRTALDIGAHVGLWSRVLAYYFQQVIAFEPVPEHVACFHDNLADLKNVELHQIALGAVAGPVKIEITPENSGNAHIGKGANGITVPLERLDDLGLPPSIDFIKIDVEGFEEAVIRGGEQLIRKQQPVMVVEQKLGNAEKQGFKTGGAIILLESWGARIKWKRSGDFCMSWR